MLSWGRRYLLCPPDYFGVEYEINPWMHLGTRVDHDTARLQWEALVHNLRAAGAEVQTMQPVPKLPDMVFTANAGLVDSRRFVVSRFRYPQRRAESIHAASWFREHGYDVWELPGADSPAFEGAGDALPFGEVLVAGHRYRSDLQAHRAIERLLGVQVLSVELTDPRFYHLDLTFCPLDERRAIVNPHGWSAEGCALVEQLIPEPLVLDLDEALGFCANSVVVGSTIVMPACSPRVARVLEGWGFDVCVSPVDEFLKAGGGVRCLTLALDVRLSTPAEPTA